MSTRILDGRQIAASMRLEIAAQVQRLKSSGISPGLGVILVGNNPASRSYVTGKEQACAEVGIYSREINLDQNASADQILDAVDLMNRDPQIHGILVQLPLPDSRIEADVIDRISPDKDVDGFHPLSVGRMILGLPAYLPCTPHAVLQILKRSDIPVSGRHVVVIGRSHIVGRPLANLLTQKSPLGNATVTLCHTGTPDLTPFTREADIVIAAAGRPGTLRAEMIREGCVVIDVGVNRIADATRKSGFRLVGDVEYDAMLGKASAITPVPGGVGPMTITMLLYNTVEAAQRLHRLSSS